MAKVTGKNQVISFASTIYACNTTQSINGSGSTVSTVCSTDGTGAAVTNKTAGAESWTVSTTLLLEGSAATVPSALDVATSGALIAYPEGDETGQLAYTWTTAVVDSHVLNNSPETHMSLDIVFECDGAPTIGVKA